MILKQGTSVLCGGSQVSGLTRWYLPSRIWGQLWLTHVHLSGPLSQTADTLSSIHLGEYLGGCDVPLMKVIYFILLHFNLFYYYSILFYL